MRVGSFREDLYYRLQVIELHIPPLRERREEIPQLIEYFLVKYAERFGRPLRRPSDALRETLFEYSWPGNVRELENVIKRFVILQDEGLVLAELKRARANAESMQQSVKAAPAAAVPQPVAQPGPPPEPVAVTQVPTPAPAPPAPVAVTPDDEGGSAETAEEPAAAAAVGPISLPELAREAAMRAERVAIQQALDRFRWNRRKAADFLGVSYKTLLNKMKECGISEQA
jgi:two-component system, NtrC family, response regulator AtoC